MIALDPDFVGSLGPPTKLTTAVNDKHDIPFARLPRLARLRVEGKADETELDADMDVDDADDAGNDNGMKKSRVEREKRKMRGKGKSMKRCVIPVVYQGLSSHHDGLSYLRKQRKNVIDPTAVCIIFSRS